MRCLINCSTLWSHTELCCLLTHLCWINSWWSSPLEKCMQIGKTQDGWDVHSSVWQRICNTMKHAANTEMPLQKANQLKNNATHVSSDCLFADAGHWRKHNHETDTLRCFWKVLYSATFVSCVQLNLHLFRYTLWTCKVTQRRASYFRISMETKTLKFGFQKKRKRRPRVCNTAYSTNKGFIPAILSSSICSMFEMSLRLIVACTTPFLLISAHLSVLRL